MKIEDSIVRAISAAVGSQIRVRMMKGIDQDIEPIKAGPMIQLRCSAYPYPAGHLQKAMIARAKQLTQDRKPMEKRSLSIVLGVYPQCTATEFYLAIAEEEQTSDAKAS